MDTALKNTLIASGVALALGAPVANAALVTDLFGANTWATDSANFTMLNATGNTIGPDGGANDVNMQWDGNERLHLQLGLHRPGLAGQWR